MIYNYSCTITQVIVKILLISLVEDAYVATVYNHLTLQIQI